MISRAGLIESSLATAARRARDRDTVSPSDNFEGLASCIFDLSAARRRQVRFDLRARRICSLEALMMRPEDASPFCSIKLDIVHEIPSRRFSVHAWSDNESDHESGASASVQ